nr:hypothetical protein [uncultured Mediterranean phage uvMED]
MKNDKNQDKQVLKEVLGWVVNKLFDRSTKSVSTIIKHDPRFKKMMKDIAVDVAKSHQQLQKHLQKTYGGTPEEIEKKAKMLGMSVDKYIETRLNESRKLR